jgi:hypothetical protein
VVDKTAFSYLYRLPWKIFHCATEQCRSAKRRKLATEEIDSAEEQFSALIEKTLPLLLLAC